jgi:hypothetical protein
MNKDYKYHSLYTNKRDVINSLLFVIGNEYELNDDGFFCNMFTDVDSDTYYGWEWASLREDFKKVVDEILEYDLFQDALLAARKEVLKWRRKERARQRERDKPFIDTLTELTGKEEEELDKLIEEALAVIKKQKKEGNYKTYDELKEAEKTKYQPYYPICNYSNAWDWDKIKDPQALVYLKEACEEIITNESEEHKGNVEFAKKYLSKQKE